MIAKIASTVSVLLTLSNAANADWYFAHYEKEVCVPINRVSVSGVRLYYQIGPMRTPQQVVQSFISDTSIVQEMPPVFPGKTFNFRVVFPGKEPATIVMLFNDESFCQQMMSALKP